VLRGVICGKAVMETKWKPSSLGARAPAALLLLLYKPEPKLAGV
jgi:hypothetical protein